VSTLVLLEHMQKNQPVSVQVVKLHVTHVTVEIMIVVILVTQTTYGEILVYQFAQMVNTKKHQPILVKTVWTDVQLVSTITNVLHVQKMKFLENMKLIFMTETVEIVQKDIMEMIPLELAKNVI